MSFAEHMRQLEEQHAKLLVEKQLALEKAIKSGNADDIVKAQNYWRAQQEKAGDNGVGKAILVDPLNNYAHSGFVEKNFQISYQLLRKMAKTPIPRAIIGTRKEQVAEFATPQRDKYSPGFIIRKKRKDPFAEEEEPTKKEREEIAKLTDFVLNCGATHNKWHADDFETFLRKIVGDSLALDQYAYEVVRNRKGEVSEFVAVDGATMRIADTYDDDEHKDSNREKAEKINGYYPSYVQIYQQRVVSEFYPWELCFGVRNPQTDLLSNAYGCSELEDLINTVTNLLNADSYNANYFRIGSNPKGFLRVKGLNSSRLDEFRSQWMTEMAGVQNAHKMPIFDADKLEFVTTQQSNKDMEYGKYYEFLVKIACAIFIISPEEIGFPLEGMNKNTFGNQGDNSTELEYSKSKGLHPLLRNLEKNFNKYVLGPASSGKYEMVFVGLNERTAEAELDMHIKEVQNTRTVNEIRKLRGDEEIEGGDIILNPIFLQNKQAAMFGDPNSNAAMDANEAYEKAQESNPFSQNLQKFIDKELID